jgi:hypothetical protein
MGCDSSSSGVKCSYLAAMKKGFILLTAAFLFSNTPCEAAQQLGTVIFSTRIPGVLDVPIFSGDGPAGTTVPGLKAQLYLVTGEGNNRVYTGLTPIAEFQKPTPSAPALAAYVQEPNHPVLIPGHEPGTSATLVMRVYDGLSFETSMNFFAQSQPFTVTVGGTNSAGTVFPDAHLIGFQGVSLLPLTPACPASVPENFFSMENEKLRFDLCFYHEWQLQCAGWPANPHPTNFEWRPITNSYYLSSSTDLKSWAHFASGTSTQNVLTLHFDPPTNSPIFFRNVRAISIDPSLRP